MANNVDFNDVLEDIFLSENTQSKESYEQGFSAGTDTGNREGYHLGYHRGAEIGRELGYYYGIVTNDLEKHHNSDKKHSAKIVKQLESVKGLIDAFPRTNSEEHDLLALLEDIRAQYKKACAMLKISSNNPYMTDISF